MMTVIRKTLKFVLPIAVIAIALLTTRIIGANKPEPRTSDSVAGMATVEATRVSMSRYPVVIRSQGTVQPTLANTLVPAVAGAVTVINDVFVIGGAFSRGDVLLQIDPRDYEIALTQAQANLAQVDAQLQEQLALADQARAEWQSMGRSGEPSELTLRVPQLAAANANRDAALAQVRQAELDLERTRVVAPYDGIVSERLVDPGQFVARGAPVGTIHSVHAVDVRLPLSNRQLTYLDLPRSALSADKPNVELKADIGASEQVWTGALIRAEGIDTATQQLNVIARISDPYTQSDQPLRVGQFVQALIEGQVLEEVFVIPRAALREEREVLIIDTNGEIQRRQVRVAWSDDLVAAIDEGLSDGELLIITPMSTVANGTPVRATIDGVAPEPLES
ncbi:MAG: efflux RND transporter periplasmic adaptor subunit [Granulosicoccus sp.]